jgi:T4-like virus tail tube protein gp19
MATGFNISTFKTRGLTLGGARPTLFEVYLSIPAGVGADAGSADKFRFTCRAAQLPAATIGTVEVPYFGRRIKLQGDRVFADWTATIMNDEDFVVRSMFEKWSNALNRLESNIRDPYFAGNEQSYKSELNVIQYAKDGAPIRQYNVIGAFPTAIDPITLDWDAQNQIETFNVTFAYDYWLPALEETNAYLGDATTPIAS